MLINFVFSDEKKSQRFGWFLMLKIDFQSQISALFDTFPLHQFTNFNDFISLQLVFSQNLFENSTTGIAVMNYIPVMRTLFPFGFNWIEDLHKAPINSKIVIKSNGVATNQSSQMNFKIGPNTRRYKMEWAIMVKHLCSKSKSYLGFQFHCEKSISLCTSRYLFC